MENYKNFNEWNEKKKTVNSFEGCPKFKIGQIWWAHLGLNVATELDGKGSEFLRPILIIQKVYGDACLVIPLTTSEKFGDYYARFHDDRGRVQYACLAQARYLDGKRLKRKLSFVSRETTENLKQLLCTLIKK